jgi:hypothetical protein
MKLAAAFTRKYRKLENLQAASFAVGGIKGGTKAAPGPNKTKTSTGRARESLSTSNVKRRAYDPGKKSSYRIPGAREARFGIKGRKTGDAVVIDMGVDYQQFFEEIYQTIPAAFEGGVERLHSDQSKNVSKANA